MSSFGSSGNDAIDEGQVMSAVSGDFEAGVCGISVMGCIREDERVHSVDSTCMRPGRHLQIKQEMAVAFIQEFYQVRRGLSMEEL